ncbi:MAG: hypothetical protein KJ050_10495 [Candidatus Omnitrophica bacterium]|nr:hypothetical protein [Candidatus Omnitrophota bacterium]
MTRKKPSRIKPVDKNKLLTEAIELLEDAYSYLVRRGLSIEEDISEFLDRSCLELNLSRWPRDGYDQYDPSLDIEEKKH